MPLYRVQITDVVIVQADSPEDVSVRLAGYLNDEYRTNGFKGQALIEPARLSDVPQQWRTSYPWGGGGERTVEQLLRD